MKTFTRILTGFGVANGVGIIASSGLGVVPTLLGVLLIAVCGFLFVDTFKEKE